MDVNVSRKNVVMNTLKMGPFLNIQIGMLLIFLK